MNAQDNEANTSSKATTAIGFPAPLLGEQNLRLRVLYNEGGLLALEKSPHILNGPHPWYMNRPVLSDAINEQLAAEKPELLRLGLKASEPVQPIFHMDPGIAGVAIFAHNAEIANTARNNFGSNLWTLRFRLVAFGGPVDDEASCDLPVARHNQMPMALISHKSGKKTCTSFKRIEKLGRYNLWEATTNYYRADQLPLHASELGIRILGETHYCRESPMFLSRLKKHWEGDRETEQPIYEAPSAWLSEVTLDNGVTIKAEAPARLNTLLKQIRKYCTR